MSKEKRIALVTGGMGGIGTAISRRMHDEGFTVVVGCSTGSSRKDTWLAKQSEEGYTFHALECDVADWESTSKAFEKLQSEIGTIDVLVNNAGITRDGTFRRMTPENWNAVINTNLNSRKFKAANSTRIATIPVGRLGLPEEIASMIAWLASDESAFSTGADFTINGGMNMQ